MSTNTEYLDLDSLAPEKRRVVTLHGVRHEMQEASVSAFVAINKKLMEIEKQENTWTGAEKIENEVSTMVEMVQMAFPTIPAEQLNALSIKKLNTILEFARGMMDKDLQKSGAVNVPSEGVDVKKD